jgi:hypothetical protein
MISTPAPGSRYKPLAQRSLRHVSLKRARRCNLRSWALWLLKGSKKACPAKFKLAPALNPCPVFGLPGRRQTSLYGHLAGCDPKSIRGVASRQTGS